jgi:hypothetical protein
MRTGTVAKLPAKKKAVNLLIFKTNINSKRELAKVAKLLDAEQDILRWNIDRLDVDRGLRIETINIGGSEIISIIKKAGYFCEELAD